METLFVIIFILLIVFICSLILFRKEKEETKSIYNLPLPIAKIPKKTNNNCLYCTNVILRNERNCKSCGASNTNLAV